ncbi:hypothetical protein MIND_00685000 [Mycena indigotica]|uniref:Uncharacterized protein n=1 Tax=Mycena indigotica TaxID=2126181 RepID=A0A8H6W497_9AGAR|nr:uncharacterized protein MIND_00685000 [Mycena indigotica]KAF7301203.1 hypothetical protein MIND_00685000 [Mycena indigotica]
MCNNLLTYGGYLVVAGRSITEQRPFAVYLLRGLLSALILVLSRISVRPSHMSMDPSLIWRKDPLGTSRALALFCVVLGLYICFRLSTSTDTTEKSSPGYHVDLHVTQDVFPVYFGHSTTVFVLAATLFAMNYVSYHLLAASLHLRLLGLRTEVIGGLILPLTMTLFVTLVNAPHLTANWLAESERGASTLCFLFPMTVLLGAYLNKSLTMILDHASAFILYVGGLLFSSIEWQNEVKLPRLWGCAVIAVYCALAVYLILADRTPELPVNSLPCSA